MNKEKRKILMFGNKLAQQVSQSFFQSDNYEVSQLNSVPEALSALIENSFDLVVLQDKDNEHDAIKICRIIKSHKGLNFIPVIYIANSFNKHLLIKAYEAGVDEYIEQPGNLSELKDIINIKLLLNERKREAYARKTNNLTKMTRLSNEIEELKHELATKQITTMDTKSSENRFNVEEIKGKFMQVILHELRSPISAINGFTDILIQDETDGERMSLVEAMHDASCKSKELLDLALAINEIDPEDEISKMRPYKISSMLEYVIGNHSQLINDKRISITGPAESELTEVVIDPDLIKEVVRIFMFNAIRNTPIEGHINISISETVDKVELSIDDSGNGFSFTDLNKISGFLKIPGIAGRTEWPGLRIAIAKFIMEIHHAEIKIENNKQGGGTAKLIFPVNNAQREALHQLLSQLN